MRPPTTPRRHMCRRPLRRAGGPDVGSHPELRSWPRDAPGAVDALGALSAPAAVRPLRRSEPLRRPMRAILVEGRLTRDKAALSSWLSADVSACARITARALPPCTNKCGMRRRPTSGTSRTRAKQGGRGPAPSPAQARQRAEVLRFALSQRGRRRLRSKAASRAQATGQSRAKLINEISDKLVRSQATEVFGRRPWPMAHAVNLSASLRSSTRFLAQLLANTLATAKSISSTCKVHTNAEPPISRAPSLATRGRGNTCTETLTSGPLGHQDTDNGIVGPESGKKCRPGALSARHGREWPTLRRGVAMGAGGWWLRLRWCMRRRGFRRGARPEALRFREAEATAPAARLPTPQAPINRRARRAWRHIENAVEAATPKA